MKSLGYFSKKKKKSINPFNNVGLAITTLVVGKKMLPKGIFFFLFFFYSKLFWNNIYWLFKGQKAFPPCHMLVSRTREIKTGQHSSTIYLWKKVKIVSHIIRLHANYKSIGLLNNPWSPFFNSTEYDFILWT